jgi:hypothetical protein
MFVVYHRVPLNGRVLSEVGWRLWFCFSLKHSTGCFGSSRSVFMLAFACLPGTIMPVPHTFMPSVNPMLHFRLPGPRMARCVLFGEKIIIPFSEQACGAAHDGGDLEARPRRCHKRDWAGDVKDTVRQPRAESPGPLFLCYRFSYEVVTAACAILLSEGTACLLPALAEMDVPGFRADWNLCCSSHAWNIGWPTLQTAGTTCNRMGAAVSASLPGLPRLPRAKDGNRALSQTITQKK